MLTRMMTVIVVCLAACASPALAQPECLTTTFESTSNGWGGNMFDLAPKRDIDLTRWQVNTSGTEMVTIEIYWREGSYRGFENDPAAWTLLGSATTQGQGRDYPTSVNVGDLPVYEGRIYGIYIHLASYEIGVQSMPWTSRLSNVYENDDLKITTGVGLRFPAFQGQHFPDVTWNGTVCYEDARPLIAIEGKCPGRLTFRWDRTEPDLWAGLCWGRNRGLTVIPLPCSGTELGIQGSVTLFTVFRTGPEGRGRLSGEASQQFCGGYLQVLVVDTCDTSNVVQVPE